MGTLEIYAGEALDSQTFKNQLSKYHRHFPGGDATWVCGLDPLTLQPATPLFVAHRDITHRQVAGMAFLDVDGRFSRGGFVSIYNDELVHISNGGGGLFHGTTTLLLQAIFFGIRRVGW
jgi:hypothetical protein